ncbi:MAG: tRNA pseudouridine(13) synthase TruD [Candidatus Peribacteria bacterium]|jgi:tRNA pseudouridine13 synthase|nr:tRNA pseudouridine(13) synthase TruD [Candidatus Peribacteria bacterium]
MLYQCKQQPEDFMVEELLPALPSGKGEVLYVYFEKKNLTTMEVVEHLQRTLHLSREELGIAGLKDKVGTTRQWITVFRKVLTRVGGERAFLSVLGELVEILQTSRGEKPLRVGANAGNTFILRLRAVQPIEEEKKKLIKQNIEKVKTKGFPNCF